jgi:hypothetical protein
MMSRTPASLSTAATKFTRPVGSESDPYFTALVPSSGRGIILKHEALASCEPQDGRTPVTAQDRGELATLGYVNVNGKPYNPESIKAIVGAVRPIAPSDALQKMLTIFF